MCEITKEIISNFNIFHILFSYDYRNKYYRKIKIIEINILLILKNLIFFMKNCLIFVTYTITYVVNVARVNLIW